MSTIVYPARARRFLFKIVFVSLLFLFIAFLFSYLGINFSSHNAAETVREYSDRITVVIDAGHGGIDGGAEQDGVFEKDLNLQISQKIRDNLLLYDVDCVMTRTEDVLLSDEDASGKKHSDLTNRVKMTKSCQNPVFVSIHMNKFPISKYSGLQVFFSGNNQKSEALAIKLQDNVVSFLQPYNNRQVKKAGSNIFVLDRLECPAVLVECGFLSNPDELQLLCSEEYQNKLAFLISASIIEYLSL